MNNLRKLRELGQSPWYDNIERRLIKSGELKRLFEEGLLGVTSNPTIFQKALEGTADYDEQVRNLSLKGKDVIQIYDELTIKDITDAADLLGDVYRASGGMDGLASIEVMPEHAYDAQKTIDSARNLFGRIGRENILIKVPGTIQAYDAIRVLIGEGINVNVTLLFSVAHYQRQAEAYIAGLKDAIAAGRDISKIRSVASVFVSRIDTKIDAVLGGLQGMKDANCLKGKAAVANSKIIYQVFKEIFYGNDFAELRKKGARIQRIVWASTSTKNPAYSDVKYVDELLGPDTVNTLPHATVEAYLDHGKPALALEQDIAGARKILSGLEALGISVNDACEEIQREGVKAFQNSFDSLIATVESKMAKFSATRH